MREKYSKELSVEELRALELIEELGNASRQEIMEDISLSERGTQQLLARLADKGIVIKTGSGRNTRYSLADQDEE